MKMSAMLDRQAFGVDVSDSFLVGYVSSAVSFFFRSVENLISLQPPDDLMDAS